jgi:hypothetical protein
LCVSARAKRFNRVFYQLLASLKAAAGRPAARDVKINFARCKIDFSITAGCGSACSFINEIFADETGGICSLLLERCPTVYSAGRVFSRSFHSDSLRSGTEIDGFRAPVAFYIIVCVTLVMNHANHRPRLGVHFSNRTLWTDYFRWWPARYRLLKEFFWPRKSPQIRNQEVREQRAISQLARSNSDQRKFPSTLRSRRLCAARVVLLCASTYREQS